MRRGYEPGRRGYDVRGVRLPPEAVPQIESVKHPSFHLGYVSMGSADTIPDGASPDMLDVEITDAQAIRRVPGVIAIETLTKDPVAMFAQPSLSRATELVLLADGFLGVKQHAGTTWYATTDFSPGGQWVSTIHGEVLIMSNQRSHVLARDPLATQLKVLTAPPAHTFASWAGRVFAGYALIGSVMEPLGIAWSAANGLEDDWVGLGSGFELLIHELLAGDKVVALRPIGFDFLAVLCRKTVWIGRRTGLVNPPATFDLRVPGSGCIAEPTARIVHGGVMYLGDDGVSLFDGNDARIVSHQINPDLLPVDDEFPYWAIYFAAKRQYHIFTPDDWWVYDLKFERWYRRSSKIDKAVSFPEQLEPALTYATAGVKTAADFPNKAWFEMAGTQLLNDRLVFLRDRVLGVEGRSEACFTQDLDSYWTAPTRRQQLDLIVSNEAVCFSYEGGGSVEVDFPDYRGKLQRGLARELPGHSTVEPARLTGRSSGLGPSLRLRLRNGDPIIHGPLEHYYQSRSRRAMGV